jgi:hypothetical protein
MAEAPMRRGRAASSTTHKIKPTMELFDELCVDFNFVKLIFNLIKSHNTTKKTTEKDFCVTARGEKRKVWIPPFFIVSFSPFSSLGPIL